MNPLSLLQITDVHLVRSPDGLLCNVDTQHTLERTLEAALMGGRPDAIIATGDIAHDPDVEVYERFLHTVRAYFDGPLACTPGNHDLFAAMQVAGLPMDDLQIGAWRICMLDSHIDDEPSAEVADVQVEDLRRRLSGAEHALVASHHHLHAVNCPWLDRDRIQSATLLECLSEHTAVRGFICGHVHQDSENTVQGRLFYSTPSTCFQFEPGSQTVTLNQREPGWRQLLLHDDGRIDSAVHRVQGLSLQPVFPKG